MRLFHKLPLTYVCAVILSFASLSAIIAQETPKFRQLEPGEKAPVFSLKSLDGEHDTDLAKLDKAMVLFFGSYS